MSRYRGWKARKIAEGDEPDVPLLQVSENTRVRQGPAFDVPFRVVIGNEPGIDITGVAAQLQNFAIGLLFEHA
jgi:hypothetical protein